MDRLDPQPSAANDVWNGHTDGAIYWCIPFGGGHLRFGVAVKKRYMFWAASPEQAVDPADLARRAVETMRLAPPSVGLTPLDEAAPLPVGMDAWLWLDDAGPRSVGPITRSAVAGATRVTATARVVGVVWSMGDGNTVTCQGAGTPWTVQEGARTSPTCGYRYERSSVGRPGGTFPVTATTHWVVDWSGAGRSGQLSFTLSGRRDLRVTEVQALQVK